MSAVEAVATEAAASAVSAMEAYGAEGETPYAPSTDLTGVWKGELDGTHGTAAVLLVFPADGAPNVSISGATPSDLRGATYNGMGELRGDFTADLPARAQRKPGSHEAKLTLKRSGDRMVGYVLAIFDVDGGSVSEPTRLRMDRLNEN